MLTEKGQEGTFWSIGNVLFLDLGGNDTDVFTPKKSIKQRAKGEFISLYVSCRSALKGTPKYCAMTRTIPETKVKGAKGVSASKSKEGGIL